MHPSNRKILVNFQNGQLKTLDTRIFRWLTSFELPTETLENKRSDIASKQADILGSSISRSSFSPCGSFVFNGNRNGKVFVWKCDTGDFVSFYGGSKDRTGVQKQISEVVFHPHDHIIAFCSFGDDQPVVVYTFDKDLLSNNMNVRLV